ncbi:hypothetical protein HYY69_02130 [Candidatus Woesearchaeota archaeon]|nr:hypothetical protein [Candidatus Woesearchaeota archaeon]
MMKFDPVGYFLIRVEKETNMIGVAFCKYQNKKSWYPNIIEDEIHTNNVEDVLTWVKKHHYVSQEDHLEYIKREFARALHCLKNDEEFIQD